MSEKRRPPYRGPRRCDKCRAEIALFHSAAFEDRMLRVDLAPDDAGTVQKVVTGVAPNQTVYGRVLSGAELADVVSTGELLYTLHRKTCSANRPRNPKPAGLEIPRPARKP